MKDENEKAYRINRAILYAELHTLWEQLKEVDYAVIKGEVLSQQIYGDLTKRQSTDIDILVAKKDVRLVERELRRLGFAQTGDVDNRGERREERILCMTASHQMRPFYKEKLCFKMNVDINHDIFWGEYEGRRCAVEDFLTDTVDMVFYGEHVKALTLDKSFVQMILHHYKEMNSLYHLTMHNTITTKMFGDVVDMLINNEDVLKPVIIKELFDRYEVGGIGYYMLYHTLLALLASGAEMYKVEFLKTYLSKLEDYREDELMECYGLCAKERRLWTIPFGERLDNQDLPKYVISKLSERDIEKVKQERKIFL